MFLDRNTWYKHDILILPFYVSVLFVFDTIKGSKLRAPVTLVWVWTEGLCLKHKECERPDTKTRAQAHGGRFVVPWLLGEPVGERADFIFPPAYPSRGLAEAEAEQHRRGAGGLRFPRGFLFGV